MSTEKLFHVTELASLRWPFALHIPSRRFRLFVAADVTSTTASIIAEFAHAALTSGMVYFCAWGPDCSRFHDIVDEVVVADDIGKRLFAGPNEQDTIMTTWHENEALDDALDFFVNCSHPTNGFEAASDFWFAMSVANSAWAATI
jgi:hypothetical protein